MQRLSSVTATTIIPLRPLLCRNSTLSLLTRNLSMLAKTRLQHTVLGARKTARLLSTNKLATTSIEALDAQPPALIRRKARGHERNSEDGSSPALMSLGVLGGIAAFIYIKQRSHTLYNEAAYAWKEEDSASMRLMILHAQTKSMSRGISSEANNVPEKSDSIKERSLIGCLVRLLAPESWLFIAVAVTAVSAAIVNLWTPIVTGDLINVIARSVKMATSLDNGESVLEALKSPARKLFVLFFTNGLLTYANTTLVTILGERVGARLHYLALKTLLSHDLAFFDSSAQSSGLVSRLTGDIAEFQSTFKKIVTQGIKAATLSVGIAYQLIKISPNLTFTLLSTTPVAYLALAVYGRYLRKLRKESREWESISAGIAGEALANIRTVKSLGAEPSEIELYKGARVEASAANNRFGFHMGVFRGLTNVSIGSMVLLVLYNGGRLVTKGEMSPGDLMAFMIATQSAQRALDSIGGLMGQAVKAKSSITRVFDVINLRPTIPYSGNGLKPSSVSGHIRFMDVDFAYPSRPDNQVLSRFNLDIPAGQVVALCGLSGSGKSTIASLVERFYDPNGGEIWLDACPINKLDTKWLRDQIGFIPQDPALFSTSIRENLRLAKPSATEEEIIDACRKANAHGFISDFPDGYDTVVGERGAMLSGGQKQRISIARAILRDPRILILDEATSSLDAESEKLVQKALDGVMVGRTVLVIAHRLTTIKSADRIVVLGGGPGQILEQGDHESLMARKGAYFKLYNESVN